MSIPSGNLLGDNSHNFHDSKDNIMGIVDLVVWWGIFSTGSHPLQLQWETRESLHFFRNPWNHCHFMAIQPSSHFLVVRFVMLGYHIPSSHPGCFSVDDVSTNPPASNGVSRSLLWLGGCFSAQKVWWTPWKPWTRSRKRNWKIWRCQCGLTVLNDGFSW